MHAPGSRTFARTCAILALGLLATPAHVSAQAEPDQDSHLYAAISANLDPPTHRATPRVLQASIDANGDVTVVFAILNVDDDPRAIRAGARADTLTVLRTVFGSAERDARSVTVIGTFPFQSTKGHSVRDNPVLRAVLSADHAAQLDWSSLTPDDIPRAVDAWWLQLAFAQVEPSGPSENGDAEADPLRSDLTLASAHLDETLRALDANQVGIGRSQFKQFFDAWDEVESIVRQRFPTEYAALDTDLERAEIALLHTQPEDVGGASAALQGVQAEVHKLAAALADES